MGVFEVGEALKPTILRLSKGPSRDLELAQQRLVGILEEPLG